MTTSRSSAAPPSLARETAERATKGRWRAERDEHGEYLMVLAGNGQVTAWDYAELSQESLDLDDVQPNANHIALFDPTVALAMADWLDGVVERWIEHEGWMPENQMQALALARTLLREEP